MAIDTLEKLKSAAWVVTGLGCPTVTPNAAKDAEWRQQVGWGYSGILADAPPVEDDVVLDNSDPAITYGGRVMREGQFPEWWENWEEPQPTEPPPNPIPLSELLAEAAGALDMPRAKAPAPPKPKAKPQPVGETHALAASIRRTVSVSATITHQDNPLTKDDIVRWQKRHTVALLLLSTLDR